MKENKQRYIQTRSLTIDDVKAGLIMSANWNGAIHEIIRVENYIVVYDWKSEPSVNYTDGYYRDTIDVVLQCFKVII